MPSRSHPLPDALPHRLPDRQQTGAHPGFRSPRQLVAQHHAADRQAAALAQRQQRPRARERQGQWRVTLDQDGPACVVGGRHEAAADRVVDPFVDHVAARHSDEAQAVRVAGQAHAPLEDEVLLGIEADRLLAEQVQPAARGDGDDAGRQAVDIGRLGRFALQPQHQRLVAAVAAAGRRQRAVQPDADARDAREVSRGLQREHELPRRPHRTDGVGAGGSDPDRKEVENADSHRRTSSPHYTTVPPPMAEARRSPVA